MIIFDKAFNQFKKDGLKLGFLNIAYFLVVVIGSGIIGAILPLIGALLVFVASGIFISVYTRLYMQTVNEEETTSFDKAMKNVVRPGLRATLLYFVQSLVIFAVMIVCVISVMVGLFSLLVNEPTIFDLINLMLSYIGPLLIITIISIVCRLLFVFTDLLIMDKDFANMSFKDGVKNGIKMAKGYRLNYILIEIVHIVLTFVGILAFGVGIIFTEALYRLLLLNLYKEAKENYFGYNVIDNNINQNYDGVQQANFEDENEISFDDFLKKY